MFGGRVRRGLVGLLVVGAVAAGIVVPAGAAGFGASASVSPGSVFLGDSAGTVFSFTVRNTGPVGTIGSVEIVRPTSSQTVVDCPTAPAGWLVERNDFRCRFRSLPGAADDIQPGGSSSAFQVTALSASGTQNVSSNWTVRVGRRETFTSLVKAAAEAPGLKLVAHTFEVTAVVVDPVGPVTPGAACPSGPSPALVPGSGGHTVVVCGRNRSTVTLTPRAIASALSGSLIASPGSFVSGPVVPSVSPVVLGRWVGATAAGSDAVGGGKTLVARIGSNTKRFSPVTPFGRFEIVNTAPVAASQLVEVDEDESVTVTVSATDADGQDVSLAITAGPSHGELGPLGSLSCSGVVPRACTATVSYTPEAGYAGADEFSFVADDGLAVSTPGTVSVTVGAINDAPVVTVPGSTLSVREGRTVAVSGVSVDDVDAGTGDVVVELSSTRGVFTVDTVVGGVPSGDVTGDGTGSVALTGTLAEVNATLGSGVSFTAGVGYTGPDQIEVSVDDQGNTGAGGALTASGVVELDIGANRPPELDNIELAVDEDDSVTVTVPVTDPDGDLVGISSNSPPAHGTAVLTNVCTPGCSLTVTYTPDANYAGPDSFTVELSDGLATTERTVTVTVAPVNDTPTNVALSNASIAENSPASTVVGSLSTTDVDLPSDSHSYSLVPGAGSADNASFQISGNQLQAVAGFDFETKSSYSVRVRTTDAGGVTFERSFTITVTNVNEAPVITNTLTAYLVPENTTAAVVDIDATDPDGTALTFSKSGDDAGDFTLSPSGVLTFSPAPDFENPTDANADNVYVVTVTVSDGSLIDSITLTVTVTGVVDNAWAVRFGGSGRDVGEAVAVDSSGNTIVAGRFRGTIDFDSGPGTDIATSAGLEDGFVAKFGPDGDLVWSRTFGSTVADFVHDVAVDAAGNVAVVGEAAGGVDFGGGPLGHGGGDDIVVAVFEADGTLRWAHQIGGSGLDEGWGVAFDGSGNVVVSGTFDGADFDPSSSVAIVVGNGDAFVAKYTAAGGFVWVQAIRGDDLELAHSVDVGPTGDVAVGGFFGGTVDLDPGSDTDQHTSAGSDEAFVVQLNSLGEFEWGATFGGSAADEVNGVAVDAAGNVVAAGSFGGTVDFNPGAGTDLLTSAGSSDGFVLKFDAFGGYVWAATMGGASPDVADGIDVDAAGNAVVTGFFRGTADFDLGSGATALTAVGTRDAFVASYAAATGALRWAGAIGAGGSDIGYDVAVGPDGTIRATGEDPDTSDYDPGPGVYSLPGFGDSDVYIVKLDAQGRFS